MVRTCPFCKSHLSLSDKFFCSECGNVLPANLISKEVQKSKTVELVSTIVPAVPVEKKTDKKHQFIPTYKPIRSAKYIFIAIGAAVIPVVALFSFDKVVQVVGKKQQMNNTQSALVKESSSTQNVVQEQKKTETNSTNFSITPQCVLLEGPLFDQDLAKVVPFDADFYLETSDTKSFVEDLIASEIISDSNILSFYEEFGDEIGSPLGFFVTRRGDEYVQGISVGAGKITVSETELKKFDAVKIEEFIVVTSDEETIEDVGEMYSGLAKSIALNPAYASAKSLLPKTGKAIIIPLTKVGKGYVFQLLDRQLSDSMSSIVNAFIDSKHDYAVVL